MVKKRNWLNSNKEQFVTKFTRKGILFFLFLIITMMQLQIASAAGLSITYDGKKMNYTSTQAKAAFDGKNLSLGGTPGIIIKGTCMLPYKDVFQKGLKASTSYNSKSGVIKIKQYGTTIQMTVGSKTAYVNNKKKSMEEAPKKITFDGKKKTKVYVPSRFVAETLGYGYSWSTSKKTAQITSPFIIKYDKDWVVYKGTKGKVKVDNKNITQSDMPSIVLDSTTLLRAEKIIRDTLDADYKYDSKTKKIVMSKNDVTINMTVGSNKANVNGTSYTMGTKARVITNKKTGKNYVMVPGSFTVQKLGYSYQWDSSAKTSIIARKASTYSTDKWDSSLAEANQNIITDVIANYKNYKDSITITGKDSFEYKVSESSTKKTLYVDIENVYNNFEEIEHVFPNGYYMNRLVIAKYQDGIRITIKKSNKASYYTSLSGKNLTVVLCDNSPASTLPSGYQLKIPFPKNAEFSDVTHQDQYYNKKFIITLKGDFVSYYDSQAFSYDSNVVSKVTVSLNSSNNTRIVVTTKKLQGYKLYNCKSYIGVKIANPSAIYKNIVVLDAGHGGKDSGATNSKKDAYEKKLNLKILYDQAKTYFNAKDSEIKAYWTRTDDTFVELSKRAEFAKTVEADLFISLHMNSATATAKGLEVLYASNNKNTMSGLNSKKMAEIFKDQLITDLNMTNRGIKDRTKLVVLYKNSVPAVLIELGFISNSSDVQKLMDSDFQKKAAKAIYDAAVTCFEKYPTGR